MNVSHDVEGLAAFASDVICRAGDKALSFYGKGKQDIRFDDDLLTEAEVELTKFFEAELAAAFPGHRIFEEQHEDKEYSHDKKRYLWIFDPMDGAANFQAGIPIWGISVALIENFWPVFGMFYMPVTGDLFKAQAGQKAFRGDYEIRMSEQDTVNNETVLMTYSRFHQHYQAVFPGKIRNMGCTAAHICYVAMGRADAAVLANESYQDLAAAQIILQAAGGKICKMDGSDFHLSEYLDGQKINDHLLASPPDIHPAIRSCLKRV